MLCALPISPLAYSHVLIDASYMKTQPSLSATVDGDLASPKRARVSTAPLQNRLPTASRRRFGSGRSSDSIDKDHHPTPSLGCLYMRRVVPLPTACLANFARRDHQIIWTKSQALALAPQEPIEAKSSDRSGNSKGAYRA